MKKQDFRYDDEMPDQENVRETFIQKRISLGLEIEHMAEQCGYTLAEYQGLESGETKWTVLDVCQVGEFLIDQKVKNMSPGDRRWFKLSKGKYWKELKAWLASIFYAFWNFLIFQLLNMKPVPKGEVVIEDEDELVPDQEVARKTLIDSREYVKLDQETVAERAGYSLSVFQKIESGERKMTNGDFVRISMVVTGYVDSLIPEEQLGWYKFMAHFDFFVARIRKRLGLKNPSWFRE